METSTMTIPLQVKIPIPSKTEKNIEDFLLDETEKISESIQKHVKRKFKIDTSIDCLMFDSLNDYL